MNDEDIQKKVKQANERIDGKTERKNVEPLYLSFSIIFQ